MVVGVVVVSAGMAVPLEKSEGVNYDLISSNDTIHDLVEKFLPTLAQRAMQQRGSTAQQLTNISLSFMPIARHLIHLKGQDDPFLDVEAQQWQADLVEDTLTTIMRFMADIEKLGRSGLPTMIAREGGEWMNGMANISSEALQYVSSQAGHRDRSSDAMQRRIQGLNFGLTAIFNTLDGLSKQLLRSLVSSI